MEIGHKLLEIHKALQTLIQELQIDAISFCCSGESNFHIELTSFLNGNVDMTFPGDAKPEQISSCMKKEQVQAMLQEK